MASREVDGVVIPLPMAGHPALDFCNTRAGWGEQRPKEYLIGYPVLALWCREYGLLEPGVTDRLLAEAERAPAAATGTLSRALAFREAFYPVSQGLGGPDQWALVAAEAQAARACGRLVPGAERGAARWQPEWPGLDAVLLSVADAAAEFLTGPLAGTVGACPGDGCGWLFGDPRGRRRWCSMAICGNRAKARRHRTADRPAGTRSPGLSSTATRS